MGLKITLASIGLIFVSTISALSILFYNDHLATSFETKGFIMETKYQPAQGRYWNGKNGYYGGRKEKYLARIYASPNENWVEIDGYQFKTLKHGESVNVEVTNAIGPDIITKIIP